MLVFALLTILTQVGGMIYLLTYAWNWWIERKIRRKRNAFGAKLGAFLLVYLLCSSVIIPPIARHFGRVPLPWGNGTLRPLRTLTCILNRHYVKPELRDLSLRVAKQMNPEGEGYLSYLDAGFPFFDGFPLLPHLSHNDGKKLDLSFCYSNPSTGKARFGSPSYFGYGVNTEPISGERDQPQICKKKGYWQYGLLESISSQWRKSSYVFDEARTAQMVKLFCRETAIRKVFIEPHLMERMGLQDAKLRFHGCQAVRHDDHLHVEIR